MPTAVAAAGGKIPDDRVIDGKNLLPLLLGESREPPHDKLYWRFGPQWAIREGDYKLVHPQKGGTKLINLRTDPAEQTDLSSEQPGRAQHMQAEWKEWDGQLVSPKWAPKAKFLEDDKED
jgi:arylsulfatase A-like enzyme